MDKVFFEVDKKNYNANIMFIPILNIKNQLSNVICIFEKSNFLPFSKLNEVSE